LVSLALSALTTPPILSGHSANPGATLRDDGWNFAVHAPHADAVELCLFEGDDETRVTLPGRTDSVHHGLVAGLAAGQEYGFRVHGRWDPAAGIFSNPHKLLLDPYARQIKGDLVPHGALGIHRPRAEDRPDERDNSLYVPRSLIAVSGFDWNGDRPPHIPWSETLIYETHVRGLTMRHPGVAPELRGSYAGVATEPVIEHLLALGVTALELMPVQAFFTEAWLAKRGLVNYWGYAPIGFFAPNARYAATHDPVGEWKEMVRILHTHGIEVILDVVYNHTGEGDHQGAALSFRGLDNPGFYRLDPADKRRYVNWTGTGNTVDLNSPWALRIVMDSMRYWVEEMHVDGFRFDLATVLGRAPNDFTPSAPFFLAVAQDPLLSTVKLIAEPWDLAPGGYQVGGFPDGWAEWNGRFRDDIRDLWKATPGLAGAAARRLIGSPDLYPARGSLASINFVTSHDGFTVQDLVAYDHKHNQANHEHNHDGETNNRSWNSGVEGPTEDPTILSIRRSRAASLLATVLLARGVPMLLGGDEMGRTQGGNNNAYPQDNEVSWFDWGRVDEDLLNVTRKLVALRRRHPQLGTPGFPDAEEVSWHQPTGEPITDHDWGHLRAFGQRISGEDLYVAFNPGPAPIEFRLPEGHWALAVATGETARSSDRVMVAGFTVAAFELGDPPP
jgi:glycogen operon protein